MVDGHWQEEIVFTTEETHRASHPDRLREGETTKPIQTDSERERPLNPSRALLAALLSTPDDVVLLQKTQITQTRLRSYLAPVQT